MHIECLQENRKVRSLRSSVRCRKDNIRSSIEGEGYERVNSVWPGTETGGDDETRSIKGEEFLDAVVTISFSRRTLLETYILTSLRCFFEIKYNYDTQCIMLLNLFNHFY
jgi:hypothetical protein